MSFYVSKLGVLVGYSSQGLSPAALNHEQTTGFKTAFVTFLKTKIPTYNPAIWGNFPPTPTGFLYDHVTGSAANTDVKNFLADVLDPAPVTGNILVGALVADLCDNSPDGWERSRTFTVIQDGVKMTTGGVADAYSKVTSVTGAIKVELSTMDIYFTVRWTSTKV